jgi:hypothetical protein
MELSDIKARGFLNTEIADCRFMIADLEDCTLLQ